MRSLLFCVIAVTACGGDDVGAVTSDARKAVDAPRQNDAPREIDAPAPNACAGGKVLFLNRAGGTYTHAETDSSITNTSLVVVDTQTLPAWPYGETSWQAMRSCIETGLAPFNVTITEIDPGNTPHHEIVFTTKYWVQGQGSYMFAISAANCGMPPANGVAFVFGSAGGMVDDPKAWCDTAMSQFASDIAGLDHSRDCNDFLGEFLNACGPMRSYVDAEVKCGENRDRPCHCGGNTQNSYQRMRDVLCH